MKKIFGLLTLLLSCVYLASAQINVDSLFQHFESESGKQKHKTALTLAQHFVKENYSDYPSSIHSTDNKKLIKTVVYLGMSNYFYENGNFQQGIRCGNTALSTIPVNIDSSDYLTESCYEVLSAIYFRLGDYNKSLNQAEMQYNLAEKLKNASMKSSALNTYSAIYLVTNRFEEAEKYAQKAIDIERKTKNDKALAIRLGMMSDIKLKERKPDEALIYIEEALELDKKAKREEKVGIRLSQKADILMAKSDWKQSQEILLQAKEIFKKTNNIVSYTITLKQLGQVAMNLNQSQDAEKYLLKAVDICNNIGFKQILPILYNNLYHLYLDKDTQKALHYLEKCDALKDTINSEEHMRQLSEFEIKFDTQEKENQLIIQQMKNTRKMNMIIVMILIVVLLAILLVSNIKLSRTRKRRNIELEAINETKNKFFSIISHDLRNPVAAQKRMLDFLHTNHNNINEKDLKESIYQLKLSNDSLSKLVKDLLQWGSIQSGRLTYNPEQLNLKLVVENTINNLQTQANNKNIRIEHNIVPGTYINEDLHFTEFILRNILSNAIKFSHPDSCININFSTQIGKGTLSVIDHGVGMNAEQLEKLFKYKVHSTQGTEGEMGTGLGLMVCKEMANLGNNALTVKSEEGKGTTFSLSVKL